MVENLISLSNKWTLEEALPLIRGLQPETRRFGYHLCLGGGVLNRGSSEKDLDLYFLSMGGKPPKPEELIGWLEGLWGRSEPIGSGTHQETIHNGRGEVVAYHDIPYPEEDNCYEQRLMFDYGGLRIDVFVVGESEGNATERPVEAPATIQAASALRLDYATAQPPQAGTYAGIDALRTTTPMWTADFPYPRARTITREEAERQLSDIRPWSFFTNDPT